MNLGQVDEDVLALFDDGGIGADLAAGLDQLDRVDQLVALVTLESRQDPNYAVNLETLKEFKQKPSC